MAPCGHSILLVVKVVALALLVPDLAEHSWMTTERPMVTRVLLRCYTRRLASLYLSRVPHSIPLLRPGEGVSHFDPLGPKSSHVPTVCVEY